MDDKKRQPIRLVIDGNKMETRIEREDPVEPVVEFKPEQIREAKITVATNGGFSVALTYHKSTKRDTLVFATSAELHSALSQLFIN